MAKVQAAAESGDVEAIFAVALYVHRLRAGIASMASAMNGLDVLVFTGGVGENAPSVRADAATGLGFLGVQIDEEANLAIIPDADVTASGAKVRTLVIEAREDIQIAAEVRSALER